MKTFRDLIFKTNPIGIQSSIKFDNGFGISVVKSDFSYGGKLGFYEIAILDEKGDLCYDTPITNDVIRFLNEFQVSDYMIQIQKLNKR